jgi:hypothetical protein
MAKSQSMQLYTGRSIEERFIEQSPESSIENFLCQPSEYSGAFIGVDEDIALDIATTVREAQVVITQTDAVSLEFENLPEHDGSITRLVDFMLPSPDKIIVRSGVIEVFRKALELRNPGVIDLSSEQIKESAAKSAIIYELGEFVSRIVYDRIALNFRSTANAIPLSNSEAKGFFNAILKNIAERDSSSVIGEYEPTEAAKAEYFRNTRPKRFSATGGWALLSRHDPLVNTKIFEESLRSYHFDKMTEGDILPPQDIGSLYPLEVSEFNLLCEFIRGTDKATPIDRFK